MDYILMHRKIAVAEIEIDEETAALSKIGTLYAPEHIPVGITMKNGQPDRGDMNDWWQGRSIPASRQNIRNILAHLGITSTNKLISKCYGLSLSDQYWANPVENPLNWETINFFCNDFSVDVGDILFGDIIKDRKISLVSPDNTSDGWLKKKWKIIDGKRYLIKGGSDPFQQQPINEAMSSIIMERLQIPHVAYSVIWEEDMPYSICENFITSKTEFISAYYIHNTKRINDANDLHGHYIDCCSALGIPGIQDSLNRMLTADFLIANYDRHLNNFGAIRNAETLKWIIPAPLFDNGSSFWCNQTTDNISIRNKINSQPFFDTHDKQITLVSDFSWLDFTDLTGVDEEFNDLLSKSRFIDTARRDALCFALRKQVESLYQLACR